MFGGFPQRVLEVSAASLLDTCNGSGGLSRCVFRVLAACFGVPAACLENACGFFPAACVGKSL